METRNMMRAYSTIVNILDDHVSNDGTPFTELQFRKAELRAYENYPGMEDYCNMLKNDIIPILEE